MQLPQPTTGEHLVEQALSQVKRDGIEFGKKVRAQLSEEIDTEGHPDRDNISKNDENAQKRYHDFVKCAIDPQKSIIFSKNYLVESIAETEDFARTYHLSEGGSSYVKRLKESLYKKLGIITKDVAVKGGFKFPKNFEQKKQILKSFIISKKSFLDASVAFQEYPSLPNFQKMQQTINNFLYYNIAGDTDGDMLVEIGQSACLQSRSLSLPPQFVASPDERASQQLSDEELNILLEELGEPLLSSPRIKKPLPPIQLAIANWTRPLPAKEGSTSRAQAIPATEIDQPDRQSPQDRGKNLEKTTADLIERELLVFSKLLHMNKILKNEQGRILTEFDFEMNNAIIEVTLRKMGKTQQILNFATNPQVNPLKKEVILYAPFYQEIDGNELLATVKKEKNAAQVTIVRTEQQLHQHLQELESKNFATAAVEQGFVRQRK